MGRIVEKKVRPSLALRKLYNNGRQSSVKQVYTNLDKDMKPIVKKIEDVKENPIENTKKINAETEKTDIVMMDTKQKIELADEILKEESKVQAKRIKKDKGLIERKENTIILTEDNRELLKD